MYVVQPKLVANNLAVDGMSMQSLLSLSWSLLSIQIIM